MGDQDFLLETYLGRLYGYAMSLSKNPDVSKDLVQECALKALKARNVPADESAYRAWLFRILRNTFIDYLRRQKTADNWEADPSHSIPDTMEYTRGDERFINELSVRIEMGKLPTGQREIIGLIDVAGLSYKEAADLLGVPVGTIMSRISRARHRMITAIDRGNILDFPANKRRK